MDAYFQMNPFPVSGDENGKPRKLIKPTFFFFFFFFPPTPKFLLRRIRLKYMLPLQVAIAATTPFSLIPPARRLRTRLKSKMFALERLYQYGRLYGPYAEADCKFLTNNTRSVMQSLHEADRQDFDFDISKLDWTTYLQGVHIPGVKKYLLGMEPDADSKALRASDIALKTEAEKWLRVSPWTRALGKALFMPMTWALRWWTGFRCEGINNVPDSGPFIIAANHNSHMDTPVIFHALGPKARNLHPVAAKDYFFEKPLYGSHRTHPFQRHSLQQTVDSQGGVGLGPRRS